MVLGGAFFLIAMVYLMLQFGYSLWAKQIVILDVIAVSAGFVIRAYAGGARSGRVSPWLVFITFSLALFLALARRRHELTILGGGARPIVARSRTTMCAWSIRCWIPPVPRWWAT